MRDDDHLEVALAHAVLDDLGQRERQPLDVAAVQVGGGLVQRQDAALSDAGTIFSVGGLKQFFYFFMYFEIFTRLKSEFR